jgi:hypothetical protein
MDQLILCGGNSYFLLPDDAAPALDPGIATSLGVEFQVDLPRPLAPESSSDQAPDSRV